MRPTTLPRSLAIAAIELTDPLTFASSGSLAQRIDVACDHTSGLLKAIQSLSVGEVTTVAVCDRQPQRISGGQVGRPGRIGLLDLDMRPVAMKLER